jgi:hypothetical protein
MPADRWGARAAGGVRLRSDTPPTATETNEAVYRAPDDSEAGNIGDESVHAVTKAQCRDNEGCRNDDGIGQSAAG